MKILKLSALAVLFVEGIVLIITGIGMQDILEVIANGTILCLSCVGIG